MPKTVGSETAPAVPGTLGGPAWRPRVAAHREEVAEGRLWTRCGYRSEVATLRAVLLGWPPDSIGAVRRPDDALHLRPVDLPAMRAQAEAVADVFGRNGVHVVMARPDGDAPPNVVFMRDLFFMTPDGAVVARVAARQRAGEERYAAAALAAAGYPILATLSGTATFEGADALWLDRGTVLLAEGFRTNGEGAGAVRRLLADQGVVALSTTLRPGVQHLLGAVTFVGDRLAAVHTAAVGDHLRDLLRERDYRLIELPPDDELLVGRGMNLVALAPGRVLMPAGSPGIRRRLEAAGVEVQEVDVGEYLNAAGGLGCLTGILCRDDPGD